MKTCNYRPDMRQFIFAIIYLLFMALLTVSFIQVTDVDVKDFFASSNIMVGEIQNDEMVAVMLVTMLGNLSYVNHKLFFYLFFFIF